MHTQRKSDNSLRARSRWQLKRRTLDSTTKERHLRQFRVLIRGHLPAVPTENDVHPRGFYVTRLVSASDPSEAGSLAIQFLSEERHYQQLAEGLVSGTPKLVIETVSDGSGSDPETVNQTGYVFFEDA